MFIKGRYTNKQNFRQLPNVHAIDYFCCWSNIYGRFQWIFVAVNFGTSSGCFTWPVIWIELIKSLVIAVIVQYNTATTWRIWISRSRRKRSTSKRHCTLTTCHKLWGPVLHFFYEKTICHRIWSFAFSHPPFILLLLQNTLIKDLYGALPDQIVMWNSNSLVVVLILILEMNDSHRTKRSLRDEGH